MAEQGEKVEIAVRLKPEIYDPAGEELLRSAAGNGLQGLAAVRINKLIEVTFQPGTPPETVRQTVEQLQRRYLVNPVVEESQTV